MESKMIYVAIISAGRKYIPIYTNFFLQDNPKINYVFYDNNKGLFDGISLKDYIPKHFKYKHLFPAWSGTDKTGVADKNIADVRHVVVDDFLNSDCDYLFIKDDDILIKDDDIVQGVETFEWCREQDTLFDIGALTLHGTRSHHTFLTTPKGVFAKLNITGEANVIFNREALESVGNHFNSSEEKGFADNQFYKLKENNFSYYDRIFPCFSLQHLGFGVKCSTVYEEKNKPFWNSEPYVCEYSYDEYKKPIKVNGFDLKKWCMLTNDFGPEYAAEQFLKEQI